MKLLLWDFDGTLAVRDGLWSSALAEVARSCVSGCSATREDFVPYLQSGFPWHSPEVPHAYITSADAWWRYLSPVISNALAKVTAIPAESAQQLVPIVRSTFLNPKSWRLFDDVVPCLQSLTTSGWKHVVLSNHVPELPALIESLGLGPHVTETFTSATLGYEKPHPQSFRAVLSAHPSEHAVMVGDSYLADIRGAEACGLSAILVRKPHPSAAAFHESLATLPRALAGV